MGYSLRTDRHRLTVWVDTRKLKREPVKAAAPKGLVAVVGGEKQEAEAAVGSRGVVAAAHGRGGGEGGGGGGVTDVMAAANSDDVMAAAEHRQAANSNRKQGRKVVRGVELYDYADRGEALNLANAPAYAHTKKKLLELWEAGFCGAAANGDSGQKKELELLLAVAPEPPLCRSLRRP
jgi:hypothetical protein